MLGWRVSYAFNGIRFIIRFIMTAFIKTRTYTKVCMLHAGVRVNARNLTSALRRADLLAALCQETEEGFSTVTRQQLSQVSKTS